MMTVSETPNEPQSRKPLLKGKTLEELQEWAISIGEKPYRGLQLHQWMYKRNAHSFAEMTDIRQELRERLAREYRMVAAEIAQVQESQIDHSRKYLFRLQDGQHVESVLMHDGKRHTICLSTQVGCAIGCPYCATGQMGFQRQLHSAEIVDQFLQIAGRQSDKITHIVFMGMGEPFLNYDNVIRAARIFNSERGPMIAARKITISTSGILPAIYRYIEEKHKFKLAISLNGSTDEQRDYLVPINRRYPIRDLLEAARTYTQKSRRMMTFEYILIAGFNDRPADARRLCSILGQIRCKLNIIPFNETPFSEFRQPSEESLNAFVQLLLKGSMTVTVRRSKGQDIAAACGQLYASHRQNQTKDQTRQPRFP